MIPYRDLPVLPHSWISYRDLHVTHYEPVMRRMRADGGEDERAGSQPVDGSETNGRVRKQVVSVRRFASAGVAARLRTAPSKIYGWATNCVPSLRTGSNVRSELGFVGGGEQPRI